jgi:hypothetical protein
VTSQLPLLEPEPRPLTGREQVVLGQLQHAGEDGITAIQAGAWVHMNQGRHGLERPCEYCAHAGNEILRALRKRGLARQRGPPRVWGGVGVPTPDPPGMSQEIPY